MNAKTVLYCLLGILFIGLASFVSIKNTDKNSISTKLNVVENIKPVMISPTGVTLVEKLRLATDDNERNEILRKEGKATAIYLATYARRWRELDCEITHMGLAYTSCDNVKAESGDGKQYLGYFKDDVYGEIVGGDCFGENGVQVLARCTNMFTFEVVYADEPVAVESEMDLPVQITKDLKLEDQLDYETVITLAELFNLPIYFGEKQNDKTKISGSYARGIASNLKTSVHVGGLEPGYIVDVAKMTINGISVNPAGNYRT
jgi:hypothetical protein